MIIENEVANLVVRGVSLASANRPPELPPDTTSVSSSLKYSSLRSLEPQERPSRIPETRIRGSSSVQRRVPQGAQPLNEELDQVPAWPYDEKTLAPQVERYLSGPDGERVLVEDVQGGQLTHALWDGSRQIDEFTRNGRGDDLREVGALYGRDLGAQLLETTAYERRLGVTKHRRPVDDDDHEDDDRDDSGSPAAERLRHVRWTLGDFLDSSSLVTNHRGKILQRYEYGAWGEKLGGDFSKLRFGYTGHSNEVATGHWGSQFRYLDPRGGRWTQRDPLGAEDSINEYGYAANSPVTGFDADGRKITWTGNAHVVSIVRNSLVGRAMWDYLDNCSNVNVDLSFPDVVGDDVTPDPNTTNRTIKYLLYKNVIKSFDTVPNGFAWLSQHRLTFGATGTGDPKKRPPQSAFLKIPIRILTGSVKIFQRPKGMYWWGYFQEERKNMIGPNSHALALAEYDALSRDNADLFEAMTLIHELGHASLYVNYIRTGSSDNAYVDEEFVNGIVLQFLRGGGLGQ